MGTSGQSSRPGVPTWARGAANWLFGDPDKTTGFMGDAATGQGAVDFGSLLNNLFPGLNAAMAGGAAQRGMASDLTNQAVGNTQNIAGGAMGNLGKTNVLTDQVGNLFGQAQGGMNQQNYMNSLVPQMFQTANDFASRINQGAGAYHTALGNATQSLGNVMNPTLYNPLFQNAISNQIAPTVNAQFASRGLGSSGAPIATITGAAGGLADQFAQRQFQEQQQGENTIANIGQGLGNLGVASSQVPGAVYNQFMQGAATGAQTPGAVFNQFMQGLGQGQQNYNLASQNQLAPLQALGLGSQQFWQGVNQPEAVAKDLYGFSRTPASTLMSGLTGVSGGIGSPDYHSMLGIPK